MTERSFEVFVVPDGEKFRIFARSHIGEAEAVVGPLEQLDESVLKLQKTIFTLGGYRSDSRFIEEFGERLFSFLFSGEVLTLYRRSLVKAREANEKVRLKLQIDDRARQLSRVPWEALYDAGIRSFVSTGQNPVFTRTVGIKYPIQPPPPSRGVLRGLGPKRGAHGNLPAEVVSGAPPPPPAQVSPAPTPPAATTAPSETASAATPSDVTLSAETKSQINLGDSVPVTFRIELTSEAQPLASSLQAT